MRRYKALPTNLPEEKVDPIPLTEDFYQQLKKDKKRLKQEWSETQQRVKDAREMGDLSENGAYKYGKFELGNIGRKLKQISFLLKHGYVFSDDADNKQISFGSTVALRELSSSGERVTAEQSFRILSKYQADPSTGIISDQSPLGKALLGAKVGQEVLVKLPKKTNRYQVISIS